MLAKEKLFHWNRLSTHCILSPRQSWIKAKMNDFVFPLFSCALSHGETTWWREVKSIRVDWECGNPLKFGKFLLLFDLNVCHVRLSSYDMFDYDNRLSCSILRKEAKTREASEKKATKMKVKQKCTKIIQNGKWKKRQTHYYFNKTDQKRKKWTKYDEIVSILNDETIARQHLKGQKNVEKMVDIFDCSNHIIVTHNVTSPVANGVVFAEKEKTYVRNYHHRAL